MDKKDFRILVVDDEPDWRTCNRKTLEQEGYSVTVADNASHAIELAGKEKFHLAFLDINMPDMDGLSLLKALRSLDKELQVVMLTGYATIDRAGIAREQGIVDFLEKIADDPEEDGLGDEIREVAGQVYKKMKSD